MQSCFFFQMISIHSYSILHNILKLWTKICGCCRTQLKFLTKYDYQLTHTQAYKCGVSCQIWLFPPNPSGLDVALFTPAAVSSDQSTTKSSSTKSDSHNDCSLIYQLFLPIANKLLLHYVSPCLDLLVNSFWRSPSLRPLHMIMFIMMIQFSFIV